MGGKLQVLLGLVNAKSLHLQCARVLHESLLVPVFTYGSETMLLKEKEKSRIRTVQMDNLRGLLCCVLGGWMESKIQRECGGVTR